jgi:hypothetical protein
VMEAVLLRPLGEVREVVDLMLRREDAAIV